MLQIFLSLCALFLLYVSAVHARRGALTEVSPEQEALGGPWFTGPLLTPSGHVVPIGYANIEPYLIAADTFGEYNEHWHAKHRPDLISINPLLFLQIGIAEWADFSIFPQAFFDRTRGKSAAGFGDLTAGFDFQLIKETRGGWWPAVKLFINETFPTAKFRNLDPDKKGVDGLGTGAYTTTLGLIFARLFHIGGIYYCNSRLGFVYNIPSHVHVKGFNTYGGGFGTNGTVRPGQSIDALLGLEFTLTKHWAFALDVVNAFSFKNKFSGKRGFKADGTPASVGNPASDQISLAPAIEYNWNESIGIIAGSWFSVAGKNDNQFASFIVAFNWYTLLGKKRSEEPRSEGGLGKSSNAGR